MLGRRTFQAEATALAKAPREEWAWHLGVPEWLVVGGDL